MDRGAIEFCSVIPTNESLTEFGSIDRREGIHPSIFLSKTHRGKSERPFCPEIEAKASALQWTPMGDPLRPQFLGSLRLWKVIRHEKCQFSPTSIRTCPSNQEGKKKYFITIA